MNRREHTITSDAYYSSLVAIHHHTVSPPSIWVFKHYKGVSLQKDSTTSLPNRQGWEDKLPEDHKRLDYLAY